MGNDDGRHLEDIGKWDRILASPMFVVASIYLVLMAALFHLTDGDLTSPIALWLIGCLVALHIPILCEAIFFWRGPSNQKRQHVWYLLLPVLRLCPKDHGEGEHAWVPGLGWRRTTPRLESYLSRLFSGPMIIIALLVLPVVAVEFFYADWIAESKFRRLVINTCSAFIWMAFVFEFVVMVSVVEKKIKYCRQNWIDLAVVLLPLVSFMGAARLGRLIKLKQLSRTAKIYRMRGLAIRSWRAIVALDVVDTILRRTPEDKIEKLEDLIEEKEKEISELKDELKRIQRTVKESDSLLR